MLHGDISGRLGGGGGGGPYDDAIHEWHVDDGSGTTVTDSAGSEDGTVNGAEWVSDASYHNGEALHFESANSDYVEVSNASSFNFTGAFTIYVQLELDTVGGFDGNIVSKGRTHEGGGANEQYNLSIGSASDFFFSVTNDAETNANSRTNTAAPTGVVTDLVGRLDSNGTALFVDGTEEASSPDVTASDTLQHQSNPLVFGYDDFRQDMYLDGKIGHVAMWDRALSDTEIGEL